MRKLLVVLFVTFFWVTKVTAQTSKDSIAIRDADKAVLDTKAMSAMDFDTYLVFRYKYAMPFSGITVIFENNGIYYHYIYNLYQLSGENAIRLISNFETGKPKTRKRQKKDIIYQLFAGKYNNDLNIFFLSEEYATNYTWEEYDTGSYFRLNIEGKTICEYNLPAEFALDIRENGTDINFPRLPYEWIAYFHDNIMVPYHSHYSR